jgi:uncharacterized protein YcfJ
MKTIYFVIFSILLGQVAFAEDCSDYPLTKGINIILVDGGTKILSTSIATVTSDDTKSYLEALVDAELEAKASISKFLEEDISKSCSSNTETITNFKINGEENSVNYEKAKTQLCKLSSHTQSLIRGAVEIGDCYTPGKLVMVTVGIKPETIVSAEELSDSMDQLNSGNIETETIIESDTDASFTDYATVTSIEKVYKQYMTEEPYQECYIKETLQNTGDGSATNEIWGAILGGAIGNQFGEGEGKDVMTLAGIVLGASMANDAEKANSTGQVVVSQEVCETKVRKNIERRLSHYLINISYEGHNLSFTSKRRPYDDVVKVKVTVSLLDE